MTIRIDRFGSVTLPNYNPQINIGTGKTKTALTNVPGDGAFDTNGANFRPVQEYTLTKRCTLHEETPEELQDALDEVKGLVGTRDQLYARLLADGAERWAYATCLQVRAQRRADNLPLIQNVDIDFLVNPPIWYGEYVSQLLVLLTGDDTFTLTNSGNKIVDDMILEFYANAAGTITELEVTKSAGGVVYGHFIYDGSVVSGAGRELVVDCGEASVLNSGANDYDHFHLQSDHRNERWIRLNLGSNTINIKRTGGTAFDYVLAKYYNQWW